MNNQQTIIVDKTTANYLLEAIEVYKKNYIANGVAEKCISLYSVFLRSNI